MSPKMKKYLTWAVIAIIVFYVLSSPQQAAGSANSLIGGLQDGAQSVITFLGSLDAPG